MKKDSKGYKSTWVGYKLHIDGPASAGCPRHPDCFQAVGAERPHPTVVCPGNLGRGVGRSAADARGAHLDDWEQGSADDANRP